MNKYIRTKDRILEVTKDTKGTKFVVFGKTLLDYETFIKSEDDILKEATTIEELCDEFVKVYIRIKPEILPYDENYEEEQEMTKIMPNRDVKIYGAIWTDKGLIYVAKMNESGELVLI